MGLETLCPVVHDIYEPSTDTWQYVVADPSTKHCVVINPTHENDPEGTGVATSAPDVILSLVKRHGYLVDWLLETHPTTRHCTAVYYLRMQLLERQGFAPRTCGGANISSMKTSFQRKYGNQKRLTTDYDADFQDGDKFWVGNMKVTAVQLEGLKQEHLGYSIDEYLFGLNWFTQLTGLETTLDDSDLSTLRLRHLWLSMARVMAFPPQCRIYFGSGLGPLEDGGPFTTVHESRRSSQFLGMGEQDFVYHWKAKLAPSYPSDRPDSKRRLRAPQQKVASSKRS